MFLIFPTNTFMLHISSNIGNLTLSFNKKKKGNINYEKKKKHKAIYMYTYPNTIESLNFHKPSVL